MISWQVGRYEDRSEVVWNKKTAVADRRDRSLRRGERGVSLASCESYSRPWPRTIPVSAWITGIKVFVPGRGILHNYPLLIPLAILNRTLSDFLLPRGALRAPIARARSGDQGKRACHVPEPCATRHWPVWTRRIYVVITTRAICIKIMSTWPVIVISSSETPVTFLMVGSFTADDGVLDELVRARLTPPRPRPESDVLLWCGQVWGGWDHQGPPTSDVMLASSDSEQNKSCRSSSSNSMSWSSRQWDNTRARNAATRKTRRWKPRLWGHCFWRYELAGNLVK